MRLTSLLTALIFLSPLAATTQDGPLADEVSPVMASMEAGVICAPETTGRRIAPGTVAGSTHIIAEEPPFVSRGRRVPAVLGVGFGVKSQTLDVEGLSDVVMTVTHPAMGAEGTLSQHFFTSIRGTDPSLTFYQFDYAYELLPGIWQMEARHGGMTLFRTTFEVVAPEAIPQLAQICGYADLLS